MKFNIFMIVLALFIGYMLLRGEARPHGLVGQALIGECFEESAGVTCG